MTPVRPIPEGYSTVTPSITMRDTAKAIDFYKRAFGARERSIVRGPDGKVMHAEAQIGSSIVMFQDEIMGSRSAETQGGSPISFYLYVENVDEAHKKAVSEGAENTGPPTDMFWGDRMGSIKDPFGLIWTLATHVKDVTPDEMKRGQEEFMKQMAER
jgi:PhnB protein